MRDKVVDQVLKIKSVCIRERSRFSSDQMWFTTSQSFRFICCEKGESTNDTSSHHSMLLHKKGDKSCDFGVCVFTINSCSHLTYIEEGMAINKTELKMT